MFNYKYSENIYMNTKFDKKYFILYFKYHN